jgi:hypothetical protein
VLYCRDVIPIEHADSDLFVKLGNDFKQMVWHNYWYFYPVVKIASTWLGVSALSENSLALCLRVSGDVPLGAYFRKRSACKTRSRNRIFSSRA